MSFALELDGIHKTFLGGPRGTHAVRGASLSVRPGEVVAVKGPSGCGKSTLLAIAGGLMSADSGQVKVASQPINAAKAADLARLRRRDVGFVFQDYNLIQTLTILENVALPLELDGHKARRAAASARSSLADLGIEDLADDYPSAVSGGQQQRAALARALIGDRRLLLADEATGALDSVSAAGVLSVLNRIAARGVAIVMATHDPAVARHCTRVAHMADGRIVK